MAVFQTLLAISYPLLVYFGLTVMEPRGVALCVGGLLVLRLLVVSPRKLVAYSRVFWLPVLAVATMTLATGASNHPFSLLLTPVAINLGLLGVFASSLLQSESTVERLAKIQVPDLPEVELAYCRKVTVLWCGFFLLNASAAFGLALWGNLGWWTFYTGFAAYVLMGTLFAAEYVYRHWKFRRYVGAPTDRVLKWFFPPPTTTAPDVQLEPEVLVERLGLGVIHQELRVPESLSVWPGHFPEYFIVPGFLQLRWVMACAQRILGFPAELQGIEGLKFKRPLLPGQKFSLEVKVSDVEPSRYRFRLAEGEEVISVGTLCLRVEDPQ